MATAPSRCRRVAMLTLAAAGPFAACRADDPARRCRDAMKAERFQQAAAECQQGFARTNDPALGLTAARALFQLGEWDRVVALGDELNGTDEERHLRQLVARSHLRAGRPAEAERA